MSEPRYLLDSNIIIYAVLEPDGAVAQRIEQFYPGEIAASSIAYGEVLKGILSDDAETRARTEALFDQLVILPFDREAARVYAELPFKRSSFDRLIAAHALATGLILVTNNQRDFLDISRLSLENWAQ
ncbi:type II toxin-antitoxin system VapC family toxin [Novosphingopyxis sp.]|uniref:type II toxin-antitoxin system VapC family toxin n=1 Tax=Novosphingopyxis sp. TaxID=2709690 RepID=UPI003B5C4DA5